MKKSTKPVRSSHNSICSKLTQMPYQALKYVLNSPLKALVAYLAVYSGLPQAEAGGSNHYCIVEQSNAGPFFVRTRDCSTYVGGEAGRIYCARTSGFNGGTVYYGKCSEERNRRRILGR